MALLFIVIGAVFDFFDGMSARLLGVSSEIGKELDSLADDVTFGVAPASMIFAELSVLEYPSFLIDNAMWLVSLMPYMAYLVAAFSAIRLAKFNVLDVRSFHTRKKIVPSWGLEPQSLEPESKILSIGLQGRFASQI